MRTLLEDASETSSLCSSVTCLVPPEDGGAARQTPGAVASKLRKVALNPTNVMKVIFLVDFFKNTLQIFKTKT